MVLARKPIFTFDNNYPRISVFSLSRTFPSPKNYLNREICEDDESGDKDTPMPRSQKYNISNGFYPPLLAWSSIVPVNMYISFSTPKFEIEPAQLRWLRMEKFG